MPGDRAPYLTMPRRQTLVYILLFTGSGASLPFIPVWLADHGMTAAQIGMILAVPLLARAVTGPLMGVWADRFRLYRTPLILLGMVGTAAYGLMMPGTLYGGLAFPVFLMLYAVGYTCLQGINPLLDAMTLQLARSENFSHSMARAAGSTAFVLANVGLGAVLQQADTWVILLWIVTCGACLGLAARYVLLPRPRLEHTVVTPDGRGETMLKRLRHLGSREGFWWLLVACGCLQAAHGFYYAFSNLIWQARGIPASVGGLLWGAGVAAEIALLAVGEGLRRRLGPWRLLVLAGIASIVRWTAMAFVPPMWLLLPLQLLHGLTFAATYLAALELVFLLSPKGYEGLGQTVNSAYSVGLLTGLSTLASGVAFAHFGSGGYGVMTVLAIIGTAAAVGMYLRRDRFIRASVCLP